MKVYRRYDWCAAAPTEGDRVKLVRAVFNRVMEDNAFRAADGEDPLPCDDIERIMKDILIGKKLSQFQNSLLIECVLDNGVSSEVPQTQRQGHGQSNRNSGDRLSTLEGKLARLENKPRQDVRDNRDSKRKPAIHNGREICFGFNTKEGCKRTAITGGCKSYNKEFAHVCNVYLKSKSGYCLLPHGRRDHK